ncbi:Hydrogenase maturation protein, carbamoyl dehydratase HypE [Caloramator quimbayensis]|uniref:Hydrogenase maturation protein, carbamoyl dehydratase HypE n=1 Tax=Caloramator quimbayensis TaxID=1147123 RepID=A0A1T4X274_9CLOT|nr:hydrogenase expression/formation protein HypE [Caloramator quimbayensis]SKA83248.1 Hydrogenase maturation protein, carbamoyl dehydratase HypE [Caloramator quimbayensis]
MDDIITLSYGSGGRKTSELIEDIILPHFRNEELSKLKDGAVLEGFEKMVFSTDSFVVNPYFFPGGDIGKLSVCGTVNDICMCGGEPRYLSLSFIIEEGFKTKDFLRIIESIEKTAKMCNVEVVTGDTKVVEKGKGDGIFINTSGIGTLKYDFLGEDRMKDGDLVIVTGNIGDHGVAVMLEREQLFTGINLVSDCRPLNVLSKEILYFKENIKIMRDPTRGGLATTLNEFVEGLELGIELYEDRLPVSNEVNTACEILGIDPLYSANEGKITAVVSPDIAEELIEKLRKTEGGEKAAIIGKVTSNHKGRVTLKTEIGGTRILTKLSGMQLPRIC